MNYHNILHDDMRNGDGLRVVLFVSGCEHQCKECQNPQTWDLKSGILFDDDAINEIMDAMSHDYISGITFSGGDPLYHTNIFKVIFICNRIKTCYPSKTVWVYTGYTWEEIINKQMARTSAMAEACEFLLKQIDVLVEGRYVKELEDVNYHWAGSTNQRVIDVQKSLQSGQVVLYKIDD